MAPKKGAKRKSGKTLSRDETEANRLAAHGDVAEQEVVVSFPGTDFSDNPDVPAAQAAAENVVHRLEDRADEAAAAAEEAAVDGESTDAEDKPNNSVVKDKFKTKYIENARALGVGGKAAKRSNWDWLSQQIAAYCLDDKAKISIGAFVALLDANGVDHSKWTNRNKGWEGRFRMTGRVALQKVVANAGILHIPVAPDADGKVEETIEPTIVAAPPEWCALYKTKTEA